MSLEDSKRQDMIDMYLEKAYICWTDAEKAKQIESWSMAANRMYYALVNAFRALLLKDQHPSHTHNGIKALIGMHYVVTGVLSVEESKLYSQMETMRERADYDCFFRATQQDVEEKFAACKDLLDHVARLVR